MVGEGITELRDAMDFVLTDRAADEMLQFTGNDVIDVIPFSTGFTYPIHCFAASSISALTTLN